MSRYLFSLIAFLTIASDCIGQIPKIGDSLKLEIAGWNLEWFGKTGSIGDAEEQMLSMTPERAKTSRLGCQVKTTDAMDGLTVHLPEFQM